jgi:hypothetical protein
MPNEDVRVQKLAGDPLLPCINELDRGGNGRKLLDMSSLDRITKNNTHRILYLGLPALLAHNGWVIAD